MKEALSQKMQYFGELMGCIPGLEVWMFSPELELLASTGTETDSIPLMTLLSASGGLSYLEQSIAEGLTDPLVLLDTMGVSWIAVFAVEGDKIQRVYTLGPVFTSPVSQAKIRMDLRERGWSEETEGDLFRQIGTISMLSLSTWMHLGAMLQYAVTGTNPGLSSFRYQDPLPEHREEESRQMPQNSTYLAEEAAMRAIEQGDLDYEKALASLSMNDIYSPYFPTDDVRRMEKMRLAVNSFITLSTRAAIRGGMSPESAYYIGEGYLDQMSVCQNLTELVQIVYASYEEFVHRVHEIQTKSLSPCVQTCCTYIQKHLSEQIEVSDLARETGYVEYYLTRKFRKEMGVSLTAYIRERRMDQAKQLLTSTNRSVQDIACDLGFCNTSYFTRLFRETTGQSPSEFRNGSISGP